MSTATDPQQILQSAFAEAQRLADQLQQHRAELSAECAEGHEHVARALSAAKKLSAILEPLTQRDSP